MTGGAAALAAGAYSDAIAKALSVPAKRMRGTIDDVKHVVILTQQGRSFDHYFGALPGVRGLADPRPISLPNGEPVWKQPSGRNFVAPFRLDTRRTSAETLDGPDQNWRGAHDRWKNYDVWIPEKSPVSMGYYTREDLPFYYALADAFTVCDAYHASIFGPSNPNRLHLMSGTSGLSVGRDNPLAIQNPILEGNGTADYRNDNPAFGPVVWTTYAERLQAAGVPWKVYQEYDNGGDNALAYFFQFRGAKADPDLMAKARGWAPGSTAQNARSSQGEHLLEQFAADISANRLPAVSWIVAPSLLNENAKAGPSAGQTFAARLLAALVAEPDVWRSTVFILNFDDNGGFFDHAPPCLPATGKAKGGSTVRTAGELYRGEPLGLGVRVPMLAISPWSKGGWVNSQVFDHTSILRFLERRFGVIEPNISAWRRSICGDLMSVFDFSAPSFEPPILDDSAALMLAADASSKLPRPDIPGPYKEAEQELGQRPSRALPYRLHVVCKPANGAVALEFFNEGSAGAGFNVYGQPKDDGPWFYTVEPGKKLRHVPLKNERSYDLNVHGPNGFLRSFRGGLLAHNVQLVVEARYQAGALQIAIQNTGTRPANTTTRQRAYGADTETRMLEPGESTTSTWSIDKAGRWYDIEITCVEDPYMRVRLAGRWENGKHGLTDPLIGSPAPIAEKA